MRACTTIVLMILGVGVAHEGTAQSVRGASPLRVGAARVDVTPSEGELPKNSHGVLDRLYARAIVLENAASSAALITVDAGGVPDAIWQAVTQQIEGELHEIRTSVTQRESWIKTKDGWMMWRVDSIQPGATLVDGKPLPPKP